MECDYKSEQTVAVHRAPKRSGRGIKRLEYGQGISSGQRACRSKTVKLYHHARVFKWSFKSI